MNVKTDNTTHRRSSEQGPRRELIIVNARGLDHGLVRQGRLACRASIRLVSAYCCGSQFARPMRIGFAQTREHTLICEALAERRVRLAIVRIHLNGLRAGGGRAWDPIDVATRFGPRRHFADGTTLLRPPA
eukprot:6515480-Prymnesium_polylepis.1